MKDHIYKTVELTGTSAQSMEEAVNNALKRAAKTVHNLRWFEVTSIRGDVEQDKVKHWQICMKVGFTLDD